MSKVEERMIQSTKGSTLPLSEAQPSHSFNQLK